jgi:dihydroorotate dehydrogenase
MFYSLLRPFLFLRDAEIAHESAVQLLSGLQDRPTGSALLRALAGRIPSAPVQTMGLEFAHPLGMAAGFDKDARCVIALQELGFAFVEVGTVTPRPQPGNARPRLWRFPEAEALVNALGFPGEGMEAVRVRLDALRESGELRIPVGVNIGKNQDTADDQVTGDYVAVLDHLHGVADFFVVNVSSPNTPGLRDLQAIEKLRPLLDTLMQRNHARGTKPLLVKIAPDLADEDVVAVGQLAKELDIAGVVAGNTSLRRDVVPHAASLDRGGLSGAPQFPRTVELIRLLRAELAQLQTLIAVGGISSPDRLDRVLSLGADLAEVYTAFIYLGPRCARRLVKR